jgi:hypothetical protein
VGYYRGDGANYYRGDYYRGDPFLGAIIGGAARLIGGKTVGRAVSKAAGWVGRQVGGRAGTAAAGAIAGGVLGGGGFTGGQGTMPINLGPLGIDPGAVLPGGRPFTTWGTKKRRRINPLNPKALRRALRRAEGFEKFSKRTVNAMYRVIDGRKVRTFKKRTRAS